MVCRCKIRDVQQLSVLRFPFGIVGVSGRGAEEVCYFLVNYYYYCCQKT